MLFLGIGRTGIRELFSDVEGLLVEVVSCLQLPQLQVRVAQVVVQACNASLCLHVRGVSRRQLVPDGQGLQVEVASLARLQAHVAQSFVRGCEISLRQCVCGIGHCQLPADVHRLLVEVEGLISAP